MEIITDNYNYEVGDLVAGVLQLRANDTFRPTQVQIKLVGVIEIQWKEMSPMPFEEMYNCREFIHIGTEQEILTIKDTTDMQKIPFEFRLAEKDMPSSFDGVHGSIKYQVVALIKTADEQEHKVTHEIKVNAPIRSGLKLSIANCVEKDFGLLSLASGRIIVHAKLPKKGYTQGDLIEVECNVYNQSSSEVTPRVTLCQSQIYMCGDRHKVYQTHLSEAAVGQKVAEQSNYGQTFSFIVPDNVCLTIKSDAIAVKYFLHVTLDIPHAFDIHVNLPFVVTTQSALKSQV